jgi:hypothetical protein
MYAGALAHITMHGADGITLFPEARDAQAFLTHLGDVAGGSTAR